MDYIPGKFCCNFFLKIIRSGLDSCCNGDDNESAEMRSNVRIDVFRAKAALSPSMNSGHKWPCVGSNKSGGGGQKIPGWGVKIHFHCKFLANFIDSKGPSRGVGI